MAPRKGLQTLFARILGWRRAIVIVYALLVPFAVWGASQLRPSGAIASLVVPSNHDYQSTRAFQKIFPEGQVVLLLAEFEHPFEPAAIATVDRIAEAARTVPGVRVFSALDIYRRGHPDFTPGPNTVDSFARFLRGSGTLRRQGLWGEHFLGVGVAFPSRGASARDRTLTALDAALERVPHGDMQRLRKIGAPYVESWIEHESHASQLRGFPLFALLAAGLAALLYRSWRAVAAILLSLAMSVVLALGAGAVLGYGITIVSALVPLTVLVTTLATLVYLHSRYVDQPPGTDPQSHHLLALADKFRPVTASSAAAVLGFAALAISPIRPVREMGLWTALGLTIGWLVSLTLFPALQRILRTPTGQRVAVRSRLYDAVSARIPDFSYRFRWLLLVGSLGLSALGLAALFGVPGYVAPVRVSVEGLDYLDTHLPLYHDMTFFRDHVGGLNVARVWVRLPEGNATDPEVLRSLDQFMTRLEALPIVTSVTGPTTFLRMRQYLAGHGSELPKDPEAFSDLAADTENLLLSERELRGFIDVATLANVQFTVSFRRGDHADYQDVSRVVSATWRDIRRGEPALRKSEVSTVGEAMLQAEVGTSLVPTLVESFAITAVLIFFAFLFVFRSLSARLMAMIPSLFAILVTFLGLRLLGGSLNVATILIATTVLGTTENDQIHFFYHLQESDEPTLEGAMRHAFRVSGRAIFFATAINATGFLGLAASNFPPLRQFGLETCAAFVLALLADFTALPAALWIVHRTRPSGWGARAKAHG